MPARESGEAGAAGHDDTGDEENTISGIDAPTFVAPLASPGDAEAEARKEAGVGIGLADDLRAIRTAIVKSQLACDFEAAFDLLLFQLARSVFTSGYHDDALDIRATETPDRPAMRVNDDAFGDINVGEKHLEIDRAAQKLDWTGLSDAEAFAELRALPEQDKRTLFASCVARMLKGQLAFEPKARPEVEATVARLDIDFAAAVRGNRDQVWTADLLWSRLRKDRILAIARETLGEAWAQAEARQKKAEIAKAMQDAFAHGDGVPAGITAERRAAAIAWTPPGFRAFDTGAVDDSASADDEGTTAPEPQPSKIDMPSVDALEHSSVDPSGADGEARQDDATEAGKTAPAKGRTQRAFPATGSITATPWAGIAAEHAGGYAPDQVAADYRTWCANNRIPLDKRGTTKRFTTFCESYAENQSKPRPRRRKSADHGFDGPSQDRMDRIEAIKRDVDARFDDKRA